MLQKDIDMTRNWVRHWVMAHNLCPFAAQEFERDRIRYKSLSDVNPDSLIETLSLECRHLDTQEDTATTLLILSAGADDFFTFLDLADRAQQWLEAAGYEGIYQLASFHPDYLFAESLADRHGEDPADYTNRAPRPLLHLLRESDIEKALLHFPHPERIPERNTALLRARGAAWCRERLEALASESDA